MAINEDHKQKTSKEAIIVDERNEWQKAKLQHAGRYATGCTFMGVEGADGPF
jgi:hypothetical protein